MAEIRKADRIQHLTLDDNAPIDISETGIALLLKDTTGVAQGRDVLLVIENSRNQLQIKSSVVYVKPVSKGEWHAGFHYEDMDNSKRNAMAAIVDSYSKGVPVRAKLVR